MLFLLVLVVSVATNDIPPTDTSIQQQLFGNVAEVLESSHSIREEAVDIREEAQDIREEAYSVINQAYQIREETRESSRELEKSLVDAINMVMVELAFHRDSQGTATELYIQEIRNTLKSVDEKVDRLEEKVDAIDGKVEIIEEKVEIIPTIEEKVATIEGKVGAIEEKGNETAAATNTVKTRQQVWMSEIRLISLYKIAEQTTTHTRHGADVVVDGQFTFDNHFDSSMRTYSHPASNSPGHKIWIKLGGLFRIYKVKVWNIAHCCQEQLTGTRIYADDRLIGVITQTVNQYQCEVSDDDPVYASTVTLHQESAQNVHVLEIQTWGTGPYAPGDLFN